MKAFSLAIVVAGCLSIVQAGQKGSLIDEQDIEDIATEVCNANSGSHRQISKVSTIHKLADYFDSVSSGHKLSTCKSTYGRALSILNDIVTSQGDPCAADKIAAIEKFHNDYVSSVTKYKKIRKAENLAAPKILRTFFMQYASRVSTLCSRLATDMLNGLADDMSHGNDDGFLDKLEKLDDDLSDIGVLDDIFLGWKLMANLPSTLSEKMSKYIRLDAYPKVTVEASDVSHIAEIQEACINRARPFYKYAILPVIRLIDLGYYPEGESPLQDLHYNRLTRVMYELAMMCENFLPIRFIKNEALSSGEISLVDVKEAAHVAGEVYDPRTEELEVLDHPYQVGDNILAETDDAYAQAKRIKSQVSARGKFLRMIIKKILKSLKSKSSDILVIKYKGTGESVQDTVRSMDEHEIPELVEDDSLEEVVRSKRAISVKDVLKFPFKIMEYTAIVVLWFIFDIICNTIIANALLAIAFVLYYLYRGLIRWPIVQLKRLG